MSNWSEITDSKTILDVLVLEKGLSFLSLKYLSLKNNRSARDNPHDVSAQIENNELIRD